MRSASCLAILLALPTGGCIIDLFDDDDPPVTRPPPPPPPARPRTAPDLSVTVRPWPPLGPRSTVQVRASHPVGLGTLTYAFERGGSKPLGGSFAAVDIAGQELGEGYGRADISVDSVDLKTSTAYIENMLVDLTPPVIDAAGPLLMRAGSSFRVTGSDAWILGGATITIGPRSMTKEFEPGFPATFGQEWDVAEFELDVGDLAPGTYDAEVEVVDAAGNYVVETYEVEIDGTAPALSILSPTEGSTVSDRFEVLIAADAETWVDLSLSGTPAGSVTGPHARAIVDASGFPLGRHALVAVARDAAGNESEPAVVAVVKVD